MCVCIYETYFAVDITSLRGIYSEDFLNIACFTQDPPIF